MECAHHHPITVIFLGIPFALGVLHIASSTAFDELFVRFLEYVFLLHGHFVVGVVQFPGLHRNFIEECNGRGLVTWQRFAN